MTEEGSKRSGSTARKLSKSGTSLYELLGISKGATEDEIKKAYRKVALRSHPDKNPNDPEATEKFKEINKANSVLMDPERRHIYNKYGSWGINVANQIGTDKAAFLLKFESPCVKALLVLLCIFTGCCYCCFCYCFCCYKFCCGKCSPKDDDGDGDYDDDGYGEEDKYDEDSSTAPREKYKSKTKRNQRSRSTSNDRTYVSRSD